MKLISGVTVVLINVVSFLSITLKIDEMHNKKFAKENIKIYLNIKKLILKNFEVMKSAVALCTLRCANCNS